MTGKANTAVVYLEDSASMKEHISLALVVRLWIIGYVNNALQCGTVEHHDDLSCKAESSISQVVVIDTEYLLESPSPKQRGNGEDNSAEIGNCYQGKKTIWFGHILQTDDGRQTLPKHVMFGRW